MAYDVERKCEGRSKREADIGQVFNGSSVYPTNTCRVTQETGQKPGRRKKDLVIKRNVSALVFVPAL